MALINQNKYPFQIEDFYNPEKVLRAAAGATAGGPNRTKTLFSKQTDKFLATLSQGFGAAAKTPTPDPTNPNPNQVNYYELRCNELNDEMSTDS